MEQTDRIRRILQTRHSREWAATRYERHNSRAAALGLTAPVADPGQGCAYRGGYPLGLDLGPLPMFIRRQAA